MSKSLKLDAKIAVASRTFSRHPILRERLEQKFANIKFNDQGTALSGESLVEFLKGAQGAIIALEPVTEYVLASLPELRFISKYGVGLNNLDEVALAQRRIPLGWSGGVNARSVSELTLTFILGLLKNVFHTSRKLAGKQWHNKGGFQLTGKTIGIIGCGFIGRDLIKILRPFDCKILINDLIAMPEFCSEWGVSQVNKEQLIEQADVITLHVPYDSTTHHLISNTELRRMKPSAVLVNTCRGNVVDEAALVEALTRNPQFAAGMDVFAVEPPLESPLLELDNFVGTPHVGGSSQEAILAMGQAAIDNLYRLMKNS